MLIIILEFNIFLLSNEIFFSSKISLDTVHNWTGVRMRCKYSMNVAPYSYLFRLLYKSIFFVVF